jgi:HK97 family phage portal protein
MNLLQKVTLGTIGGLDLRVKKVGNQVPLVESYRDGLPILKPFSLITSLERDIKQNPFLYSALRKKADSIASVPFYVEEFRSGKWVRVENHPAENLIENANPFMSGFELKKLLVYHKELSGSAYMQIVSSNGVPVFLQPLFPQWIKVVPSESNFIQEFEYAIGNGPTLYLPPNEVFWTKHSDPADPYIGLSPLAAVAGEIQTDLEARRWNKISLSNRGASDVAFIMRNVVTQEDYEFARRMIEDRMSGPDNARRPWVLGGDSDVRPLSYTAIEMDYINTRKFNREVISAALGVPAPLIGDADNSTYNNLDTLKKDFWQDTITVWLEELRQDLTRQILIPYFGDNRRTRTPVIRYMYDLSNVESLQQNLKDKVEIAKGLREVGYSLYAVNSMLEFDVDLDDERNVNPSPDVNLEPVVEPVVEPEVELVDEENERSIVTLMARSAITVMKSNPELFERLITEIHLAVCRNRGVSPDSNSVKGRVHAYLLDSDFVNLESSIVNKELGAVCKR